MTGDDAADVAGILRTIIKRLETEVGAGRRQRINEPPPSAEYALSGKAHIETALRRARRALASGDRSVMSAEIGWCLSYENQGRRMNEKFVRQAAGKVRRDGGAKRGAQQRDGAAKFWEPWQASFRDMCATKKEGAARQVILRLMTKQEIVLPGQEGPPSPRTLRKWLK